VQHPREEILSRPLGQDKIMFPRVERALAINGWWEQAMQHSQSNTTVFTWEIVLQKSRKILLN